jgi:uncharacterized repeat protein (TIGR01451 family)
MKTYTLNTKLIKMIKPLFWSFLFLSAVNNLNAQGVSPTMSLNSIEAVYDIRGCRPFDPKLLTGSDVVITNLGAQVFVCDQVTYEWESATNNAFTENVVHDLAFTRDYDPAPITVTTYFRRKANATCSDPDCSASSTSSKIVLTVDAPPAAADAGSDQTKCDTGTFTLAANIASIGEGTWTVQSGTASITDIHSPKTEVTNVPAGSTPAVLRWTIVNYSCSTFDEVILTNNVAPAPAEAGLSQSQCNNGSFTLAGNTAAAGIGTWTVESGTAAISSLHSATSGVTGVPANSTAVLRWTIQNGVCSTTDIVSLTNDAPVTVSAAGNDQSQCNNSNFTLAGNLATSGTGLWEVVSGTATITNPLSYNSAVTGVPVNTTAVLSWTITNGSCKSSDEVSLRNDAAVTVAAAGNDQAQCNNGAFTLAGNAAISGTGLWEVVSGTANITNPALYNSGITGVPANGTAVLSWTITNGTCSSSDQVSLRNDAAVSIALAGDDQSQCNNGSFTLAGNAPSSGTGAWAVLSGTATITNPSQFNSGVTGVPVNGTAILSWTITNGSCSSSDQVSIRNDAPVTVAAAGSDQTQCNNGSFALAGNTPSSGTGTWTLESGTGQITSLHSATSGVTGVPEGTTATLRWTIVNGTCSSFDEVSLTNNAPVTTAAAGPDQAQCDNGSFTLAGNSAAVGTGTWTVESGTANITALHSPTSGITGVPSGTSALLRWTVTNGTCSTFDEVLLTNDAAVTIAAAGTDQAQCNTSSFTLAGNAASVGTGTWTVQNGTATITSLHSATSGVTGVPAGTYAILRWTIANGTCSSFDEVMLTNDQAPVAAAAGNDQAQCDNSSFTLAGNAASVGTGTWTLQSGTATITNLHSATSGVTGVPAGSTAVLRWTIVNGTCSSFDEVSLTNDAAVTIAAAGADQAQCNNGNFTLAGNAASVGTGTWTVQTGTATITNNHSAVSGVTGVPSGTTAVLRWTILNGTCSTFDEVSLTNDAAVTVAAAGSDMAQCNNGSFTLGGNIAAVGTGTWTVQSGTANITSLNSATSAVTGVPQGTTAVLRWTIVNGTCSSFDEVSLTNNAAVDIAAAGTDQAQCDNGSFTLAGNAATVGAGTWTVQTGTATITSLHSATSGVTGVPAGSSALLRWTIVNGTCSTFDEVILTNHAAVTIAAAGADQAQCSSGSFTLAGNPPSVGMGTWTVQGGTASINAIHSATSLVTGVPAGTTALLRWTIVNGTCSSYDEVSLTHNEAPVTSTAGADQAQCNNGSFTLAGNAATVGTGTWTVQSGTATISSLNSATSGVTGVPAGVTAVLRWTIVNGTCSSFDEVSLTNNASVTVAAAGSDQAQCNSGSFTLAGNAPSVGNGTWTVQSGTATISSLFSPTSGITGVPAGTTAVLRWTIVNGTCSSFDEVSLTNNAAVTVAAAGIDQAQCNNTNFTLAGNAASVGVGTWSVQSGTAVVASLNSATSTVSGVPAGTTAVLRWTIVNGTCSSFDEVSLTNNAAVTIAAAGSDQTQCNIPTFTLAGNTATVGTGTWTVQTGTATITSLHSATSGVTGVPAGTSALLRWTIVNGTCSTFDEVLLTNDAAVTIAAAGTDIAQCNISNFTLAGNAPVVGTGTWTVITGTATITSLHSASSGVTGVPAGTNALLRWTIVNGTCSSFDEVSLTNNAAVTIAAAGSDQAQCNIGSFTLAGNSASPGTGTWTVQSGTAMISSLHSPTSGVIGVPSGTTAVLRWTIVNGTCSSFDEVSLTNHNAVTVAAAGPDQALCNNGTFTLSGNVALTGVGTWTVQSGTATISDIHSPTSVVTSVPAGTTPAVLRWTIVNGTCSSFDEVSLINNTAVTIATAGPDQALCGNSTFTLAANSATSGVGTWTVQNGTATIANIHAANSEVTGVPAGSTALLRWTIANGTCGSFDEVSLTNDAPVTVAAAGADQAQCGSGNFTLAANAPSVGTGTWTVQSGTATVVSIHSPTSAVTGVPDGVPVVLRWTIVNGTCSSFDEVSLRNQTSVSIIANAGPAQNLCSVSTVQLAGNNPSPETGFWSLVSGPNVPVITSATLYNTTVTNLVPGVYIFKWTISNGICTPSESRVTITIADNTPPTLVCHATTQVRTISGLPATYTTVGNEFDYISVSDRWGTATVINNLTQTSTLAGYVFPLGSTMVTWIATDKCKNTAFCSFAVTITALPVDLQVIKTINNTTPAIGSEVIFTLTVTNKGPGIGTNVKVNDLLPSGFTYVSDDRAGAYLPATGVWTIGTLAVGANTILKMKVLVNAPGTGISYENIATVAGKEPDPLLDNNISKIILSVLIANDDTGTVVPGLTGGTSFINVLVNDTWNGVVVNPADINLSFISSSNPGVTLVGSNVVVAAGTPAGNYILTYQICLKSQPSNCDQAIVTVPVSAPNIDAIADQGTVDGLSGGTAVPNVLVNDLLNGVLLNPADVTITFISSTNPGVTLSGTSVLVAPGTPSNTYYLDYRICEKVNPSNCDQTTVTVIVNPGIRPGLVIVKKAVETSYSAVGDVIHYNIEVINTSDGTLYNSSVSDLNAMISSRNPITSLQAGVANTYMATHIVTQQDIDAGQIVNCALVSGVFADGVQSADSSECVAVPALQRPQLTITKFVTENTYRSVGEVIHYTLEVYNCGNVTATNIVVSDPGAVVVAGSPILSLAPRQTLTAKAEHVVTQADIDAGKIVNVAYAKGIDPTGKAVSDESNEVALYANQPPKLVLTKFAKEATFKAVGEVIHYTINVKNLRNTIMLEVIVRDQNAVFTSVNTDYGLPTGQSITMTAEHVITQRDLNAGKVINLATATGKDLFNLTDSVQSNEVTVYAKQLPSLTLTKTADETSFRTIGDLIHYSNKITNTGNVKITGITLADPNTTVVGSNQVSSLNPGESIIIRTTHYVAQADLNVGFVEKASTVIGSDPNSQQLSVISNSLITRGVQIPELKATFSAAEVSYNAPGDIIHYSIEIQNTGNVMITNVTPTELDARLTGNAISSIIPGGSAKIMAEYVVTQADLTAGRLVSSATVSGYKPGGQLISSKTNEIEIPANKMEGIAVSQVVETPGFDKVGQVIHYSITVKNYGNIAASDISVIDPNSVISDGMTVFNLQGSGSLTIRATHVVTQADLDSGVIVNLASIQGTYQNGNTFNTQSKPVKVFAIKNPQMTIRFKSDETSFNTLGQQIHYSIEVSNTGNLTLADIEFSSPWDITFNGGSQLNLAPGNTAKLTALYTVTLADLDAGKVVRSVSATGTDPDKQLVMVPGNEVSVVGIKSPELSTTAVAEELSFSKVGDIIHYNILVKNSGNVSIVSTLVTDPNSVIITARPSIILVPDETFVVSASHMVTQNDLDAGKVVTEAKATGFDLYGNTIEKVGNKVTVVGIQDPKMLISNSPVTPIFRKVGDVVNYSIQIQNNGNITIFNMKISDAGSQMLSSAPIESLHPGEFITVSATRTITQHDLDIGKVVSVAKASGFDLNGKPIEKTGNSVTIPGVQLPDLNAKATTSTQTFKKEGDVVVYTVVVENKGNITLDIIQITDKNSTLSFSGTIRSLAPGAIDSLKAEYTITSNDVLAGKVIKTGLAQAFDLNSQQFAYLSNEVTVNLLVENYNLNIFPNPFAYETTIAFDLPVKGEVTIKICDMIGQEVRLIVRQVFNEGRNFVTWKPLYLPQGLYFVRMYCNGDQATKVISVLNKQN